MTLTAAPFGTAVRALRAAAGRRALQLALLLGGLLALGFLCGEQAHAAEGTPATPVSSVLPRTGHEAAQTAGAGTATKSLTAPATATKSLAAPATATKSRTAPAVQSLTAPAAEATSATAPVTAARSRTAPSADAGAVTGRVVSVVRGVTGGTVVGQAVTSVEAVADRVVTPVRTVVRETAGTLDEARSTTLPGTSALPVPELPGVSELPVHRPPVPVIPVPGPDRHGGVAPAGGQAGGPGTESAGSAERTGHRTAAPARPSAAAYGPDAVSATAQAPAAPAHTRARHAHAPAGAPAQRPTPPGDPDGALGKQAAEGTAYRHGDAHAIALDGRAPLRLLPGATARVDAPGTRERHRDIPLFPG
ncbi:hypothetical protein ACIRU2_01555 [Streptomyces sp. NPDC101169]|uniref:hypothetical protein n=1 Tax=Streptomyces sp. NPDC101169 TaxID=3366121 RepID=UPI00382F26BF